MNRHMNKRFGRYINLSLVLIIVLTMLGSSTHSLAAPAPHTDPQFETIELPEEALSWRPEFIEDRLPAQKHPKLDTHLQNLINAADGEAREALIESGALRILDGRVQVQISTNPEGLQNAFAAVEKAGGLVTKTSNDSTFFQSWLPISALKTVAGHDEIHFIRPPDQVFSLGEVQTGSQTTEGLAEMNGDAWHAVGILGDGVKVAIIDAGFQGYISLLGTDLPTTVTVKNFVDGETDADINTSGGVHGLACAEIVHDIAPQAQLYLAKIATALDLQEAVTWAINNHVDIISTSGGFYNVTPGDGLGFFEDLVQDARSAGVLWVTAAGNSRERHWGGIYNDPDNLGSHWYTKNANVNIFTNRDGTVFNIPSGSPLVIFLRWDDWTHVDQDYDLYLIRWTGSEWELVAFSENDQNGSPGQRPTESIYFVTSASTSVYGFVIRRRDSNRYVNFEVFVPTVPHLNFYLYDRSLPNLADSASAMTVGAVDVVSPYDHEPYSSQGPTNGPSGTETGGFFKPDIAAFANVSTVSYGSTSFAGTSAATPHVTGAAALALSAYTEFNPDQLQTFLEGRAIDVGLTGMDSIYGHGRLYLGDLPTTDPAPSVTSITPNTGENMAIVAVNISGANYSPGASVKITMTGQNDIIATNLIVDSDKQISCNFDLMGAATGAWHVVVTNPDAQSGTLPNGFTVSTSTEPHTWELVHDENPWPRRDRHSTVVLNNDESIVLMGGYHYLRHVDEYINLNDVWRSMDQGVTWEQMTDSAPWSGRRGHTSVVLPDDSIVLMGGGICEDSLNCITYNDVWRSTDQGANWIQMTDDAAWVARDKHTSVVLPDGSIVLMGGASCESIYDSDCVFHNDVWRSTDQGVSWTQMTDHADWESRYSHSSVAMNDGSILLLGGKIRSGYSSVNDVWRSTDQGATWTRMTESAPWSGRRGHTSVTLPDDSIVLMGGKDASESKNDVWRSTDQGTTWTQMTADAEWPIRISHTCVALPDGSIVLMGGYSGYGQRNDVWRSTDQGANWTQMDSWMARAQHSSVVLPDESIVLMGGYNAVDLNDVWRSTDQGATWTNMTADAEWMKRHGHTSVVMSDGSIVMMGGWVPDVGTRNDVWRSTDQGATWTQMTDHAEWERRISHTSVALPDDSIVLMGSNRSNDVWRSTDQGATWTQMIDSAEWTVRVSTSSVALPDGSIVLMGGVDGRGIKNDVWRSMDQGATWTQMTAAAWPARRDHTSVALPDGSIVVMGGSDARGRKNDVWRSTDQGASWRQLPMETEWTARSQHTSVALADATIVLMGGFDSKWNGLTKDVWRWATGIGPKPEPAPIVTNITPNTGENTGPVDVTISGANFESGAMVKLTRTGQPDLIASGVSVDSATQISCSIDLTGAAAGEWHVVVTNPDEQSGTLPNGFTVTSPSAPAPSMTSITPNTGENTGPIDVTISGANFESGATVKLTKTGQPDIIATGVWSSATQISCSFDLTGAAAGNWHVVVTNPDAQTGTLLNGFTVTAPQTGWHYYLPLMVK